MNPTTMGEQMLTKISSIVLILAILFSFNTYSTQAATPSQIQTSIDNGLAWLATQQQADGRWQFYNGSNYDYYDVATTAIVVLKMEDRARDLGNDPFDTIHYPYAQNIKNGLNYILDWAKSDVFGYHFPDFGSTDMYTSGIVIAALSASTHPGEIVPAGKPLAGQTYLQVVQGMVNCAAGVQGTSTFYTGGWGYYLPTDNQWVDNSVTGYMSVGLGYVSAAPPRGFGMIIPASIITRMGSWVNTVQLTGGIYDGGSLYNPDPGWASSLWVNTLKTGNLLYEFSMIGVPQSDPRVTRAVNYINTYWASPGAEYTDGAGWLGDYQAMFAMMKGLQAYGITMVGTHDWFAEVADYIVTHQAANGSWISTAGEIDTSYTFSTACALLTLEKAVPSALSLSPQSASNPTNTQHTVTATYLLGGAPQTGITIQFRVIYGPNTGVSGSALTNASGQATFTYTGSGGVGTDTIEAKAKNQAGEILATAQVTKQWTQPLFGSIRIFKYYDYNLNGVQNAYEPALSGWYYNITGPNGYNSSGSTDATGILTLSSLVAGTYIVTEQIKPPADPGGAWYVTNNGFIRTVTVSGGGTVRVEFGNAYNPHVPASSESGMFVMIGSFTLIMGLLAFWRVRRHQYQKR
jgi:hypothetical protein